MAEVHGRYSVRSLHFVKKKCKPGSKCKLGSKCIRGTDSCIVGSFNRFHFFFHFNDIAHEHDKTVYFVCNLSFRE